jgi:hypothetical protein
MGNKFIAACAAAFALAAPAANAAIDLSSAGSGGFVLPGTGGTDDFEIALPGGVSVLIEGGTIDNDGGNASFDPGLDVFQDGSGLGLVDATLDGVGGTGNEVFKLTFSKAVSFDEVTFSSLDNRDDVSFFEAGSFVYRVDIGKGANPLTLDLTSESAIEGVAKINGGSFDTLFGTEFFIAAGVPIGGNPGAGPTDNFTMASIGVSPVPLPAAGLVLLTALGGAAAAYRRRKG